MGHLFVASIVIGILLFARRRAPRHRGLALRDHPAISAVRTTHGRGALFIPGSRDLDDAQTLAALALLDPLSAREPAGEAPVSVLASQPLVMIAACDWSSRIDGVVFSSSDPWGFAMSAAGRIRSERPALCVAAGGFSGEALLIADAADASGAAFVCGTADLVAAPALLLTTDAILVGEEMYAAPAIVSDSRTRLAMLHGHDACRALVIVIIVVLVLAESFAAITGSGSLRSLAAALASPLRGGQ